MKINRIVILLPLILLVFSGCLKDKIPLPKGLILEKADVYTKSHIIEIHSYSILNDSLDIDSLKPIKSVCKSKCEDCKVIEWNVLKNIEDVEKKRITSILLQDFETNKLSYMQEKLKKEELFYFAGCYTESGSDNNKFNFYEYMYLIDMSNKKLLIVDYVGENY